MRERQVGGAKVVCLLIRFVIDLRGLAAFAEVGWLCGCVNPGNNTTEKVQDTAR